MSEHSAIEWTDATWNPLRGCTEVSDGCAHCYAPYAAVRLMGPGKAYDGLVLRDGNGKMHWTGVVRPVPEKLQEPLHWREPKMVFVNSMSDLFHKDVSDSYVRKVFGVMSLAGQHTYQVLTKRAERVPKWFADPNNSLSGCQAELVGDSTFLGTQALRHIRNLSAINGTASNQWPLPNVWLGVSVENQKTADDRIPHLLRTPAAVRFLSVEPLLGAVDLSRWLHGFEISRDGDGRDLGSASGGSDLHWVICGGESGPGARPMHPDWARSIRDQCAEAGVPFFFKQWGGWAPSNQAPEPEPRPKKILKGTPDECIVPVSPPQKIQCLRRDGKDRIFREDGRFTGESPGPIGGGDEWMTLVGKKAAGRLLDGRTWDQMPERAAGVQG